MKILIAAAVTAAVVGLRWSARPVTAGYRIGFAAGMRSALEGVSSE